MKTAYFLMPFAVLGVIVYFSTFYLEKVISAPPHHAPASPTQKADPPSPVAHKVPNGGHPVAPPKGVHPVSPVHNNVYHLKYGHTFKYGTYYKGWNHNHWSQCVWDNRYGCYLYLDPGLNVWYYYCFDYFAYLPVTYCPLNTYAFDFVENQQEPANVPVPPPAVLTPQLNPALWRLGPANDNPPLIKIP